MPAETEKPKPDAAKEWERFSAVPGDLVIQAGDRKPPAEAAGANGSGSGGAPVPT